MYITSSGIQNGRILDRYGKRGVQKNPAGILGCSLPFKICDAPVETVSFAFILEDKDAIPVTKGFAWIHWVACNVTNVIIEENASFTDQHMIQGLNSWTSIQGGELAERDCCCYGGMGAPDCPHLYELHVYALDCMLNLKKGFWANHLYHAMKGHILAHAVLKGQYDD